MNIAISTRVSSSPELAHRLCLAAQATEAGRARSFTRQALEQWQVHGASADVEQVVSELVSNAICHARRGGSGVILALRRDDSMISVEVFDGDPSVPVRREPGLEADRGRGLKIVGALAARWGYVAAAGGKCAWAEFDLPRD